ncbi:uncharacterized protein LOC121420024 [Lytechinus variegatus]|uniref:uncharacterized protein LOC121420024 n=1 Tax=Lytechinus variegatus TaxID=7654 RepID=UPI001BB10665|nr:uncharacterized protein LOC121420024 [Lytechinus variegatus]
MAASSREELKEEIQELRGEVLEYEPGKASVHPERVEFPENLYIGLFGRTGCGKTSLINSLKFAAHGKFRRAKWLQVATQEKAGGHTMYRRFADITKRIFVIDNRGLDDPNTDRATAELLAQLAGERGYGSKVEWQGEGDENEPDTSELDLDQENKGHPIGCAVFVFSATHDFEKNTTGLMEVVDFLHIYQGRYPVAVITHVDVTGKDKVETLKTVLRVCGISDIFEVANLTDEKQELEEEYQLTLLSFIERCMTDGDETLVFKYYQQKEERRRQEIKKKQEEKERKEEERARREQEHEKHYERALREAQVSRQDEIRRIMKANRHKEGLCSIS